MNFVLLTKDKLDVGIINDLVTHETCGAISLFIGTTRNNFESKKVAYLEYEAFEQMAVKQMDIICEEVRNRWSDVHNIAIHHRIGVVPVREASVVIAISSPHRQSSLNAVAFSIEELKRRVPIWKKEIYIDDESTWKENKECQWVNETPDAKCTSKEKPGKMPSFDYEKCSIQQFNPVPSKLVQICVEEQEIKRRISRFVEKKREEIDFNNVLDFTAKKVHEEDLNDSSTCARTDSLVVKQEHSKCHLRVKRAVNRIGPQTKNSYLYTLDKLMSNVDQRVCFQTDTSHQNQTMQTHTERMATIENHLGISINKSKNILERLRKIENRILFLESISPEYKHFFDSAGVDFKRLSSSSNTSKCSKQIAYSVQDLDSILDQMNTSN